MQLRLSLPAMVLILAANAQAEDYVTFQYLQYNESDDRVSVSAPSIMINKDFGTDYTLNVSFVADAVSGASPTYYAADTRSSTRTVAADTTSSASAPLRTKNSPDRSASVDSTSGASAYSRGKDIAADRVQYGNVSFSEQRAAGGATLTSRFANRDELIVGGNFSSEHDFESISGSAEYMHWLTPAKNQSLSLGISYQSNQIIARCVDLVNCDASSGASEQKHSSAINMQMTFLQNLNATSYIKAALFYIMDDGYLTDPYLNVVRNNDGVTADVVGESRPEKRRAFGAALHYAKAFNDALTLQLDYRYYQDDWDITSHTLDSDLYYDLTAQWRFKLGLRGYTQSAANFYNATANYFTDERYASSDYRLSDFHAITYKTDLRYAFTPAFSANIGLNYYDQSTSLKATYLMTGFRYNF